MAKSKDTLTSLRKRITMLEDEVELYRCTSAARLGMVERADREKAVLIRTIEELATAKM